MTEHPCLIVLRTVIGDFVLVINNHNSLFKSNVPRPPMCTVYCCCCTVKHTRRTKNGDVKSYCEGATLIINWLKTTSFPYVIQYYTTSARSGDLQNGRVWHKSYLHHPTERGYYTILQYLLFVIKKKKKNYLTTEQKIWKTAFLNKFRN